MMKYWNFVAAQIEVRSLRERLIIMGVLVALMAVFAYLVVLSPTLDKLDRSRRAILTKEREITQLAAQTSALLSERKDPDAPARERIEQLKTLLSEIDAGLAKQRERIVSPKTMPQLLAEVIARNGRLQMVGMKSLPPAPLLERQDDRQARPAQGGPKTSAAADSVPDENPSGFFRHGVEIKVRGDYLDLVAYLFALEQLPMQVFWREVIVKTGDEKDITMTLTLFTVSLDKNYIIV